MNVLTPFTLILLSLTFVSSHFSHAKYEQKYVDVNSWSFSDSVKGKRYVICKDYFLLYNKVDICKGLVVAEIL